MIISDLKEIDRYIKGANDQRYHSVIIISIFAHFLESVGIITALPLLTGMDSSGEETNFILNFVFNFLEYFSIHINTSNLILIVTFLYFAKAIFLYVSLQIKISYHANLVKTIRINVLNKALNSSLPSFNLYGSAEVFNLIGDQAARSGRTFDFYIHSVVNFAVGVLFLVIAFIVNPVFTSIISLLGVFLLILSRHLNKYVKAVSKRYVGASKKLNSLVKQTTSSIEYMKFAGPITHLHLNAEKSINDMFDSQRVSGRAENFVVAVREPVILVLLLTGIFFLDSIVGVVIGTLFGSIILLYKAFNAFVVGQRYLQASYENFHSLVKISEFVDSQESINYVKRSKARLDYDLVFESVFYKYENAEHFLLSDVSFELKPKTTTKVIGKSGSGKSTLLRLMAGLIEPQSGNIKNNLGVVGYVSQHPYVFDDTIRNNISLWNSDITNEKIIEVLNSVGLESLGELNLDTIIGETSGFQLSGGQIQRLCIARELTKKIDTLILDEPTSSLDLYNTGMVSRTLDDLHSTINIIIITHDDDIDIRFDNLIALDKD